MYVDQGKDRARKIYIAYLSKWDLEKARVMTRNIVDHESEPTRFVIYERLGNTTALSVTRITLTSIRSVRPWFTRVADIIQVFCVRTGVRVRRALGHSLGSQRRAV